GGGLPSEAAGRLARLGVAGDARQGERQRCLGAGVEGCLSKPVRQDELRKAVDELSIGPAAGSAGESETPVAAAEMDWQAALAAVDFDEDLLRGVVEAFLEECPKWMAELDKALRVEDRTAVRRLAHSIKGGMRLFEDRESREAAWNLEQAAQDASIEQLRELYDQIGKALDEFLPKLRARLNSGHADA